MGTCFVHFIGGTIKPGAEAFRRVDTMRSNSSYLKVVKEYRKIGQKQLRT